MNCAYRLIWNEQLNAWVVAPEIASARGKRSRVRRCAATLLLTLAAGSHAALAADLAATALPGGGQVSAGQATISGTGANMAINQSSQRAIINWQNFDIGSQASVNFQQPNSSAVTLNRAGGPTASRIEGQLTANGQVFLVNPNGVLFGSGARVNVGGLVASTLNIRDDDFLSGNYVFSGKGGSITNQGQITAAPGGYLAFISPTITNSGTLSAPQGTVAMGAGERVRLNFAGDRLVGLDVSADTLDTLITNNQAIRAEGGAILLTAAGAESVTRGVINNTGVLEAGSLTQDGGRIVLSAGNDINLGAASTVAVDGKKGGEITVQAKSGTLLADGSLSARGAEGNGGSIQLLGNQVGLINAAQVDASGATGGGTVLVGGDYQGGNAEVQNAFRTYVGPHVTIKADALKQGDGGKVIVWADDVARFYGKISATGGVLAGNGGFVEVSGKGYLDFNGVVDTTALNGSVGTLLLDPTNIEVITGGTATLAQVNQFADPDLTVSCAAFGGAACSRIAPATINAATANVVLQATNNILFSNAVSMTNPGWSLTATAQTGNITVNAPITTANRATSGTTGAVTLNAGGAVVLNADIMTGNATVADAAGNQTAASGNIGITAGTGISGVGRLITGNAVLTGAAAGNETIRSGTVTLNVTGAGAVWLSGTNALTIGSATGNGAGSTATTGNITFTSADRINNGTAGGAIDVSFGVASAGATNNAGSLTATTDGGAGASGEIVITSGEALRLGAVNAAGGAITLDVGAATTAAGVISGVGTSLTKLGTGTLTLSGNNLYTGATNINAGTLALGAANRIANASAVTVASGATFNLAGLAETVGSIAGAGNITLGLGAGALTAGGDNTTTIFSGVISGTGNLAKAGTGALTLSGANTYSGNTTVSVGTLVAANATALGAAGGTNTVTSGATLNVNNVSIAGENVSIAGTGVGAAGALTGTGAAAWGGSVTMTANSTVGTAAAADTLALNGVVGGAFALSKAGAGKLTLTGANTHTGATNINAGTLVAASNGALGTAAGATTVASGATLALQGGITIADALTLAGTGVSGGGALRNDSGNNTASGAVTLGAGGARINSDAGLLTLSGNIGGATQPLTVGGAGNTTISGAIGTTTGTLTKDGTGTLTLSGNNAYTGATNINAGTLALGAATSIADASAVTVASGATFNLNGFSETIGSLAGAGTVTNNGAAPAMLTTGGNNTTTAFSGSLQDGTGTLSLTKTGTGTFTLSGSNTYGGTTTISGGGTLIAANNAALGAATPGAATVVNAGATLALQGGINIAEALTLNGTGVGGGGALRNLGGNNTSTGAIALASAARINSDTGLLTLSGAMISGPQALTIGGAGDVAVSKNILTGAGGLTKDGTGTLTLSGANTYSGATTISGGTLVAANAAALGGTAGDTTVANGAVLRVDNVALNAEAVTLQAGGTLSGNGAASLAGTVTQTGAASLAATGGSTLTLNGAVNAGGFATTISGPGSVVATNAANDFSSVTISGAQNVNLRDANNLAFAASNVNGALTAAAGGTLTLNGALTAGGTGDAIVLSGSRFVNSAGAGALTATNGRWLVWSSNTDPFGGATPDDRGGQGYDFKQYNATFGVTPVAQVTGNGFLYSLAPSITPALTGTVSKVYDGNTTATLAPSNFTPTSGVDGDVVAMSGTGTYDNPNVAGSPTKLVTATGIAATVTSSVADGSKPVYGYTLTSTTANANIGEIIPAPLTVASIAGVSTTYGTPAATGAVTLNGVIGSDAVTSTASLVGPTYATSGNLNAGSYAQNASSLGGADAGNYTLTAFTTPTANYTVGQLALTGAAIAAAGSTYGSPLTPGAVSFGNVIAGDVVTSTASVNTATLSTSGNPIVGSYTQTAGALAGADAANYSFAGFTTPTASYTINPLALTGSITANDKVYDATPAATIAGRSLSGVIGSDNVTYTGGTASFADKNAGIAKTVTATGLSLTGADAGNYTVNTTATTTANITPAPLVISADDASRPVDTPNPQFTASYAGFVGGETPAVLNGALSFSTLATLTSPAGIYPITPYGQSSGNYAITYRDGKLTIQGPPVVTLPFPREVVSQQAIGAKYTDPTMPTYALSGLQYTFDEKDDAKDEKFASSVVRVVGSGIRLSN